MQDNDVETADLRNKEALTEDRPFLSACFPKDSQKIWIITVAEDVNGNRVRPRPLFIQRIIKQNVLGRISRWGSCRSPENRRLKSLRRFEETP